MSERKPNNTPWIVLGVVCGGLLLSIFGIALKNSYESESFISLDQIPEVEQQDSRQFDTKQRIFIDGSHNVFINDNPVEDLDALLGVIENLELSDPSSTLVILRLHEDAQHRVLIDVKDALDEAGYESLIEFVVSEKD